MMRQMFNYMRPFMGGAMGGGMPGMGGMQMPDLGSLLSGGGLPKMPKMPPGMRPGQMPPGFPPMQGTGMPAGPGSGKKFKKRRR